MSSAHASSMRRTGGSATPAEPARRRVTDAPAKTVTTSELFGTLREIAILHAGDEYKLRITSNGKLILTK